MIRGSGLLLMLALRSPSQDAAIVAQSRISDQVAQTENGADDKEPQPPAGQWVVQLAQVLVPDVPGGLRGNCFLTGSAPQPEQQIHQRGGGRGRGGGGGGGGGGGRGRPA